MCICTEKLSRSDRMNVISAFIDYLLSPAAESDTQCYKPLSYNFKRHFVDSAWRISVTQSTGSDSPSTSSLLCYARLERRGNSANTRQVSEMDTHTERERDRDRREGRIKEEELTMCLAGILLLPASPAPGREEERTKCPDIQLLLVCGGAEREDEPTERGQHTGLWRKRRRRREGEEGREGDKLPGSAGRCLFL